MEDFDWKMLFTNEDLTFSAKAVQLFQYQYKYCAIYNAFVQQLNIDVSKVNDSNKIPFLPIQFFKSHKVTVGNSEEQIIFTSSGTTGATSSQHFVKDLAVYETAFTKGFEQYYSNITDYCILGLLPSYLERQGSSLIYMVNALMQQSKHPLNGFYLNEYEKLYATLKQLETQKQQTILIGVTFALLDFATQYSLPLHHTIIMETGGMKGRGKEPTRNEVQDALQHSFGLANIHSEYGMTELLSQAYSSGKGLFYPTNTMQVLVRSNDDPMQVTTTGKGLINVIDLANVYSCSFIATDDIGVVYANKSFEVLGRVDNSEQRGCSLLAL